VIDSEAWADTALGTIFYLAAAIWGIRQCARADINLRELFGLGESSARTWDGVTLVVPLILLSLGSFWLFWFPLSYLLPGLTQHWALEYEPPVWNSALPLRSIVEVIVAVLIGPVVEELVFRGVILQRWHLSGADGRAAGERHFLWYSACGSSGSRRVRHHRGSAVLSYGESVGTSYLPRSQQHACGCCRINPWPTSPTTALPSSRPTGALE